MTKVFLHLGSNVGNRKANLLNAVDLINKRIGRVIDQSAIYETEAWGNTNQDDFLNVAVSISTVFAAERILEEAKKIELEIGPPKTEKWGPRACDIDIIFFADKVIKTQNLLIPHPQMQNRNFVLIPIMEIGGEVMHPILKKTVEELYEECHDPLEVYIYES